MAEISPWSCQRSKPLSKKTKTKTKSTDGSNLELKLGWWKLGAIDLAVEEVELPEVELQSAGGGVELQSKSKLGCSAAAEEVELPGVSLVVVRRSRSKPARVSAFRRKEFSSSND